jgi:hypothetical protein
MLKDGAVFDLHIHYWRARRGLEAQDLGLVKADIPDLYKLGYKMLVDPKEINKFTQFEQSIRRKFEWYSLPFFVGQTCRFVPLKVMEDTVKILRKGQTDFDVLVSNLLRDYEGLRSQTLDKYSDIRSSLEPYYPTRNNLQRKFKFQWNAFQISQISDTMNVDNVISEFNEFRDKLKVELNSFVESTIVGLREEVSKTCDSLIEKINSGDIVRSSSIEAVNTVIDRFNNLNFAKDSKVEATLNQLRKAIKTGKGRHLDPKEDSDIRERIRKAAEEVGKYSKDLSDIPTMADLVSRSIDLS